MSLLLIVNIESLSQKRISLYKNVGFVPDEEVNS